MTQPDAEFPYPLVSTDWLAAGLDRRDLRIVDASWRMPGGAPARRNYEERHIPGAVFFDIDEIADKTTTLPHMLPSAEGFAKAVGDLGIGAGNGVVIYDDSGIFSAARAWWTFCAMGHDRVSVLDGGLPKWLKEGRPVETGAVSGRATAYAAARRRPLARSAADVRCFLDEKQGVLLDARPAPRFRGEADEPRPHLRRGHMPGALNLPHGLLIGEDGAMRPLHELARLFHERGVHAETDVILSCGSGVTAAVLDLALERLGHRRHALYDGSWAEWGAEANDPALFPVAAGQA